MKPNPSLRHKALFYVLFILLSLGIAVGSTPKGYASTLKDPLIQILIKKRILTEEEAEQIQREARLLEEKNKEDVVQEIRKSGAAVPKGLKGIKVGMLGYVDYSVGKKPLPGDKEENLNAFKLTRGYLTIKKKINPWLGVRMTTDIHQDDDEDWKVRLKYLYAELKPQDIGFLTDMKSEIGMGHIPWLDFEEHINPYRCQGTMATERAGTFNSADLGISIRGNIGGLLEDAKEKTGNHHYDGKFGSWHLGIYNGSGYHAKENNDNKVLEGRLTLRPMPDIVPGLQVSYFGLYGEGNKEYDGEYPDYNVHLGMISYEHPSLIVTAQYFTTEGNAKGKWVDPDGNAIDTEGYSFFANLRLPIMDRKFSVFGRYDHFDPDKDGIYSNDADYDMYIAGLSYRLYKDNMILVTYETTEYDDDNGGKGNLPIHENNLGDDYKFQMVYQIKF